MAANMQNARAARPSPAVLGELLTDTEFNYKGLRFRISPHNNRLFLGTRRHPQMLATLHPLVCSTGRTVIGGSVATVAAKWEENLALFQSDAATLGFNCQNAVAVRTRFDEYLLHEEDAKELLSGDKDELGRVYGRYRFYMQRFTKATIANGILAMLFPDEMFYVHGPGLDVAAQTLLAARLPTMVEASQNQHSFGLQGLGRTFPMTMRRFDIPAAPNPTPATVDPRLVHTVAPAVLNAEDTDTSEADNTVSTDTDSSSESDGRRVRARVDSQSDDERNDMGGKRLPLM